MCRVWYEACITKVTCDGRPEQGNKIPGTKEHDNGKDECKAGSQDRNPDGGNGRCFRSSERSNPSRRRRRPTHSVPTQTAELPDHSAANVSQATGAECDRGVNASGPQAENLGARKS